MHHARWLTKANRILRLYISEKAPSIQLVTLANFIMKVYGPTWFEIKSKKSCTDGSSNLFNMIKRTRYLKGANRQIVERSVQHNGYYAHHENILLGMLFHSDEQIREKGISWISEAATTSGIREFKVPEINFKAKNFMEMVDWSNCCITVPPLVSRVKYEELKDIRNSTIGMEIYKVPCHSQAVERAVKIVTEASALVTQKKRNGFILSRQKSRTDMPKVNSKKDFVF